MKQINKLILSFLAILIVTNPLFGDEQQQLKELFLKKIETVTTIVQDITLTKDSRNSKIVKLLVPTFDFELMAKLSLGSKEWKKLTEEQQVKFVDLYVERMKQSYSSKLDSYSGQNIEVTQINQPTPNRIELVTNIISAEENLEIAYKYHKPPKPEIGKESWLIYDVTILGISILKTDRAQFSEFLQTKTIDDLMTKLENI
jgi:phospholipid transport system substrate-binding protein